MKIYFDEEVYQVDGSDRSPKGTLVIFRYTDSQRVLVARNTGDYWEYPVEVDRELGELHGSYTAVAAFVPEESDR